MKKQLLTLSLLSTMSVAAFAQSIPNGGFEDWVTITPEEQFGDPSERSPYQDLGPEKPLTKNFLRTINESVGGFDVLVAPELTSYRSTDAHSGDYSIRLRSTSKSGTFVPGAFTTGDIINLNDVNNVGVHLGRPYAHTAQATNFEGWFKYEPQGNDSALFQVYFLKNSVEIGRGEYMEKNAVSDWTKFDIAINWTSADIPDTVVIAVSASAAINFVNLFQCQGEIGSQLFVDDIAFTGNGISVNEASFSQISASLFPNPAIDKVTLSINQTISDNMFVQMFDLSGKKVVDSKIVSENTVIETSNLNAGVYIVSVLDNGAKVFTKKVIIK